MNKSGFSLLETTVAVAILIIAVVGPLTLASTSIKSFSQAKNGLLAASLAQEGIELVRNYRSSNVLGGRGWLFGMDLDPSHVLGEPARDGSAPKSI